MGRGRGRGDWGFLSLAQAAGHRAHHFSFCSRSFTSTVSLDSVVYRSVRYHPEAAAGPHDSAYLFERFKASMG
jgi:carbamoylphosphate synthase small subunit